ncbi:hypothetical protein PRUPE_2G176500 [Prunus persica]|uniref:Uncharacterized protein n=1 Tax=Prunus persica TaxID=3760 RepID=A0A251QHB1_PRUPE|nr:hypothetical protein PRUPE_2G176500 [Prunus persica]
MKPSQTNTSLFVSSLFCDPPCISEQTPDTIPRNQMATAVELLPREYGYVVLVLLHASPCVLLCSFSGVALSLHLFSLFLALLGTPTMIKPINHQNQTNCSTCEVEHFNKWSTSTSHQKINKAYKISSGWHMIYLLVGFRPPTNNILKAISTLIIVLRTCVYLFGPIMSMHLGNIPAIVVSSPTALELLLCLPSVSGSS